MDDGIDDGMDDGIFVDAGAVADARLEESILAGGIGFVGIPSAATDTAASAADTEFAPAWYQDPSDPESIRYWDGAAWTNLVTPKLPPLWSIGDPAMTSESLEHEGRRAGTDSAPSHHGGIAVDRLDAPTPPTPPTPPDARADTARNDHTAGNRVADGGEAASMTVDPPVSGWRPDPLGHHDGRYFDNGEPTGRVRDGSRFYYETVSDPAPSVPQPPAVPTGREASAPASPAERGGAGWTELPPLPPPPASARVDDDIPATDAPVEPVAEGPGWVGKAETALSLAEAVDTAATWREAMRAAAVMADMAKAMFAATEAEEKADHLAMAAEVAAQKAVDAKLAAERATRSAEEAAESARVAVEVAAKAKQAAERSVRLVADTAEASEVASAAADGAMKKARALAAIVTKARQADTPEAWSEALALVSGDVGDREQRDADSGS